MKAFRANLQLPMMLCMLLNSVTFKAEFLTKFQRSQSFARVCSNVNGFYNRCLLLTAKVLKQG